LILTQNGYGCKENSDNLLVLVLCRKICFDIKTVKCVYKW
jgi:hypothetical protein